MHRLRIGILALLVIVAGTLPHAANAYWRGGVFFGFPAFSYYVAPPVYYAPPPVVYAPPPVVYAPPSAYANPQASSQADAYSQDGAGSCSAGAYICPLDRPLQPGAACSCPANRGRVSGFAR